MAQLTMEQQHTNLANEARWVKWLLEGLAWVTAIVGTVIVAFFVYEGVTAPEYEGGGLYFVTASSVFGSTLVLFLLWKLLAIAVGNVSLKHRRLAGPDGSHDAVEADRFESLVK